MRIERSDETKVEKKRIIAKSTMSFRYVKMMAATKRDDQGVPAYQTTPAKSADWKRMIHARIRAKPKNFPRMNSYRAIGLLRMR
jgi:hypothetical protein